ncbi:conserved membrane hypothetical protein [Vibrio crassostreae]|uniref:hypothetical protein n=1 Tax=Vibrio crassostreae TaxID=246167 RepID=UPI001049A008|nr:hypothetical protein [Vibrio crassostreae]TCT41557.1 hypothetical protein EDB29_103351 [Vibrio crassostreae]TCV63824.1 hypothetical protein EDB74_102172 [Vibrio crassostreae]CAK2935924.1 conserved membrane hypothetical protein [Vibrio crassostreae]CAK2990205.1 conserved membrane hypothetical protein [Vibrio crassostreae]
MVELRNEQRVQEVRKISFDIKGVVTSTSEWLVGNGSWLFPIALLLLSFVFRWGWGRRFTKMNFFKLAMVFPIDVKITACTFVLAAMVLNPNDPFGVGGLLCVGLIILACSITAYNHLKIEETDNCDKKYINRYFVTSLFCSIVMLVFSILIMQAYESKEPLSSSVTGTNQETMQKGAGNNG